MKLQIRFQDGNQRSNYIRFEISFMKSFMKHILLIKSPLFGKIIF